ncbi:hypothetical protein BpHYR1_013004 [Brachionus plicatilis]|uniref:Uncharacterized protein n=1 Tax=Brachionus plicatilis TaxID=10195 RepID=A0A3M7QH18_BRAPC|nr:hypothetical protein BpHYR1_013004 [Brachionus plicatilis]
MPKLKLYQSFNSDRPKHIFAESVYFCTKDVSVAKICRTCFGPSQLKLWHFLFFVFVFCTEIHNALSINIDLTQYHNLIS